MFEEQRVIVRTKSAGVFFATLNDLDRNCNATLSNSRRLWYWAGAASLSDIAVNGVAKPNECRFPVAVPKMTVTEVIEVIPASLKACESIDKVAVWTEHE